MTRAHSSLSASLVSCLPALLFACTLVLDKDLLVDADGDGYNADDRSDLQDCDDADAAIHPGADERCNGADDDCDGLVDDGDASLTDATTWYADGDGDGYGLESFTLESCARPPNYTASPGDCNDADPAFHPGADETDCTDPSDYNCDGVSAWADEDADTYAACVDCDDRNAAVHPGAIEVCNGLDDDCDDRVDIDATDTSTWNADDDGDGFGDPLTTTSACAPPAGFVADATDCDDGAASIYPSAAETPADGIDQDCDCGDLCFVDADGDGAGTDTTVASADLDCADPGESPVATDCLDTDDHTYPGAAATESSTACQRDADDDGYGESEPPKGVTAGTDCDDGDARTWPGAAEVVDDGIDEDCDGGETCYEDADDDGFLAGSGATRRSTDLDCADRFEGGATTPATDCDDADVAIYPGAPERCGEGVDANCDGTIDSCRMSGTIALVDADRRWTGHDMYESLGDRLAGGQDLNGDGTPDLVLASPGHSGVGTGAGGVYVISGAERSSGDVAAFDFALFEGEAISDAAGSAVAVGDFDVDGQADLLVGAYTNDRGGSSAGAAYVLFGPLSGTESLAWADEILVGEDASDRAGFTVATAGTVDAWGHVGMLIGAPWADSYGGRVYGFLNAASCVVDLSTAPLQIYGSSREYVGYGLDGGGDFDGDGLDDTLVGAPYSHTTASDTGYVSIILGGATGTVSARTADVVITGSAFETAGMAVAWLGDVDGDGLEDAAAAANGVVYVVTGGRTGSSTFSSAPIALTGLSTADAGLGRVGDMDRDDLDDIVIGDPTGAGCAWVVYGGATGTIALETGAEAVLLGETEYDQAGHAIAGVGDLDGDGSADLLVGAPGVDALDSSEGSVYLFFGVTD